MMMMSDLFEFRFRTPALVFHMCGERVTHTVTTSKNLLLQNAINHRGLYSYCTKIADTWRKGFDSQILIARVRLMKIGKPFCKSLY